ncbi:MAG: DUF3108 domain-containing protein [Burkholderiaceae bacterium]|nr:DUF3108 domain-containing protein [Burkholderiaceae bacterium]
MPLNQATLPPLLINTKRYFRFVFASLLLHFFALLFIELPTRPVAINEQQERIIAISMEEDQSQRQTDQFSARVPAAKSRPQRLPQSERQALRSVGSASVHTSNNIFNTPDEQPPLEEKVDQLNTVAAQGAEKSDTAATASINIVTPKESAEVPKEAAAPAPTLVVKPLASAHLEMLVTRKEESGRTGLGAASLTWKNSEDRYELNIEASVSFVLARVNLYKLSSVGRLGENGIAPETSTEARLRRAETATHFQHEDKLISFSATSKKITMEAGAQDKASVVMQLAAIGNADEKQFYVGREILIQVAEERDALPFLFVVVGQEMIESKLGTLQTWHLVRPPRPGSYNSRLDLWFAPSLGWYPVQITNTERNGNITTQTVTKITH